MSKTQKEAFTFLLWGLGGFTGAWGILDLSLLHFSLGVALNAVGHIYYAINVKEVWKCDGCRATK